MYIIINYYSHTACGLFLLMLLYSLQKEGKKLLETKERKIEGKRERERERDDIYWHFYFPNQLGFSYFFLTFIALAACL